jgi:hypothetical protein
MLQVDLLEDDRHVRIYDEEGKLISVVPSLWQAEQELEYHDLKKDIK